MSVRVHTALWVQSLQPLSSGCLISLVYGINHFKKRQKRPHGGSEESLKEDLLGNAGWLMHKSASLELCG